MKNKTHYRKVFKSDHLGVADLEDLMESGQNKLTFMIKHVKQEIDVMVAGKKGSHNIAYFVEPIKPLVLNAGNSKIMKEFNNSPFVENWSNTPVELYIENNVRFGRETTSGVRIRKKQPLLNKPELTPDNVKVWSNAIAYLKNRGNIDGVKKSWSLSNINEQKLKDATI